MFVTFGRSCWHLCPEIRKDDLWLDQNWKTIDIAVLRFMIFINIIKAMKEICLTQKKSSIGSLYVCLVCKIW